LCTAYFINKAYQEYALFLYLERPGIYALTWIFSLLPEGRIKAGKEINVEK
jgi:hypothetical protein